MSIKRDYINMVRYNIMIRREPLEHIPIPWIDYEILLYVSELYRTHNGYI